MPKLTSPLFSQTATGSYAKLLTFRRTSTRPVAVRYSKPHGEPTTTQLAHRATFAAIAADWVAASADDKASWAPLAEAKHISNYAAYTAYNWELEKAGQPRTAGYPGSGLIAFAADTFHATTFSPIANRSTETTP